MAETGARRVVVVEDHPIFRDGVVQCLDAEPDFAVVGQWASGDVDLVALGALAPDLVLMDVELPVISGIEATRRIRAALARRARRDADGVRGARSPLRRDAGGRRRATC